MLSHLLREIFHIILFFLVAFIVDSFFFKCFSKKMKDLNAHDVDEAAKIIAGSARSMGIEVVE